MCCLRAFVLAVAWHLDHLTPRWPHDSLFTFSKWHFIRDLFVTALQEDWSHPSLFPSPFPAFSSSPDLVMSYMGLYFEGKDFVQP